MTDPDQLAQVAIGLACRVRDEAPADNLAWLIEKLPEPRDWRGLCFVLAAAVPIDKPWLQLTAWTVAPPAYVAPASKPRRGRPGGKTVNRTLKPCGTRAAALRHRYHHEEPCEPCREAEREHERNRSRARRPA